MKNGWQTSSLSEVCEIKPSKSEARDQLAADALVSFAPMEDLGIGRKLLNATQVKKLGSVVGSYTYFADGDVLLAKITPCFENGKLGIATGLTNGVGFGSSEFIVLRPSEKLDKEFLYYFLARPQFRTEGALRMGGAVGQQRVPREFVETYRIPLPPIPEQRRIVSILDEAFAGLATAKANAEKNLQNARALFVGHVQSVFVRGRTGWVQRRLGDIAHVKGGKRVPKGEKLLTEPTDYPYLRVSDFSDDGTIDVTELRYISPEVHCEIKNYVINSPDLYISIAGTIGKTGIIPKELDGANLTENACRLVFNPGISNHFAYYFTLTPDFIEQAGLNTRTAAQPKLALSRLATIKLRIPSFEEQLRVVAEFDRLREETGCLQSVHRRKIDELDALKKSLLHQAFTGNL